jgi:hypothetical protein
MLRNVLLKLPISVQTNSRQEVIIRQSIQRVPEPGHALTYAIDLGSQPAAGSSQFANRLFHPMRLIGVFSQLCLQMPI